MHAILLSIGDELVLGQTLDTNSAWLAARLAEAGLATLCHQTVADDLPAIADAIRLAAERAELVIITGGLGPTDDDLTRQALADAMGQPLELDTVSLAQIQAFFDQRGRPMPERNRAQAMHPRTATAIANPNGTAPGIKAKLGKATIYVTPGVPREMFAMFRQSIAPELDRFTGGRHVILAAKINTFGSGESTVAERLGELMDRKRNPKVGTTVSDGIVSVRVRAEFATADEARDQLARTIEEVEQRLGPIVFGRDNEALQHAVVNLLIKRGRRLATAESCTGGLVGQLLTDVPGCSEAYVGGWITYTNAMKSDRLGVPQPLLEAHGAVSEPVARAMAEGALRHAPDANLGLAITGIAGPDGGTATKPVGTVWLALAQRRDEVLTSEALCVQLPGDRDAVRDRAAKCALQMLRFHLLGEPLAQLSWARQPAAQR